MMSIHKTFIITALALCVLLGCGQRKRPDGLPVLYPCEITITQGGLPLAGAVVRLAPEEGTLAWPIVGKTNADGVAVIETHVDFPGAPEGTFKVLVSKTELTPSKYTPPAENASVEEWNKYSDLSSAENRWTIMRVKPEYNDVGKTSHSITIIKGKNQQTFDVGDPVEIRLD